MGPRVSLLVPIFSVKGGIYGSSVIYTDVRGEGDIPLMRFYHKRISSTK